MIECHINTHTGSFQTEQCVEHICEMIALLESISVTYSISVLLLYFVLDYLLCV